MDRRTLVALPLTALAVGAAIGVPLGSGQAPAPTLELQMRHSEARVTLIDSPPVATRARPGESPGDRAVGRGVVRDLSGTRLGTVHNDFLISAGRGHSTNEQVNATFVLRDGQIATQGVIDQVGASETLAIVGGTGAYTGARGSVEITGDRTRVRFSVRLG